MEIKEVYKTLLQEELHHFFSAPIITLVKLEMHATW
jgi:hypothetical protein